MQLDFSARSAAILCLFAALSACGAGTGGQSGSGQSGSGQSERGGGVPVTREQALEQEGTSIFELFRSDGDTQGAVTVNRYLWNASLEVLNFLPIETIDPFSGVISTGYGTPPGGGRAYRATVLVRDPALDARSLIVSMQARGGGEVSAGTLRAVEDAILTRARQLRIEESRR